MKEVTVYTVDYCPFCKKAEILLNEKNIKYTKIDISANEEEYRAKLGEYYDIKGKVTVPQIIIGTKRIGGFDALAEMNSDGSLDSILED